MFVHLPVAGVISVAALAIFVTNASAADVAGLPRIVDGDTVEIGSTKIRLSGIDAPETNQLCLDAKGEKWACGVTSRDELVKYSHDRPWMCHVTGIDKYPSHVTAAMIETYRQRQASR
jgi:endonuclease YncB( thermonuclease family)